LRQQNFHQFLIKKKIAKQQKKKLHDTKNGKKLEKNRKKQAKNRKKWEKNRKN